MDFSQEELDEILNVFSQESEEIVNRLTALLLALEKEPHNKDIVIELFRGAHSLKGAARMIGFNNIQAIAHKVEDILGLAKNDELTVNSRITDVLCKAVDYINLQIQLSVKAKQEVPMNDYKTFMSLLNSIVSVSEEGEIPDKPNQQEIVIEKSAEKESFEKKEENLQTKIFEPRDIIAYLYELEENSEIIDVIIQETEKILQTDNQSAKTVFTKVLNILKLIKDNDIKPDKEMLNILKQSIQLASKLLNDSQIAENEDITLLLQSLDITEQMISLRKNEQMGNSLNPVQNVKSNIEQVFQQQGQDVFKVFDTTAIKTLRVDTAKLDKLVNQIGEVIISKIKTQKHVMELEAINNKLTELYEFSLKAHNYLKYYDRKIAQIHDGDINNINSFNKQILSYITESQSKLNEEIHEIYKLHKKMQEDDTKLTQVVSQLEQMVKDIRLLPLATVFHMVPRMVRDIAKEKGKEIDLNISGSETNADKKIIEEIKTPLIHIIRNAIDHGIETPSERIANGKSASGKINLNARHKDNKIIIEVADDGRGVELDKIRNKALTEGLLTPEELKIMTDEQIMNLIFWPGFTTEEEVTDISGRGIGLDVVQTKISRLNGKVKVQSVLGQGTKVTIELPVTMATIKSFIVKLNSQYFAIPVSAIKAVVTVKSEDIYKKDGKDNILYLQSSVPIYNLASVLGFESDIENKDKKTILLIEAENNTIGFVIEELIGGQEILNKELTPPLFKINNISGITTLVSGEVCLIVNVSELLKSVMNLEYKQLSAVKTVQLPPPKYFNAEDYRILVVDDFMTTRTMLKNILSVRKYNVDVANDAIEALSMMSDRNYDLVISDVEMPKMSGYEFASTIKNSELKSKTPVILISSLAKEDDVNKALESGADFFVDKNKFNQQDFLSKVEQLISKNQ